MNCFENTRYLFVNSALFFLLFTLVSSAAYADSKAGDYAVRYTVEPLPDSGEVAVTMRVRQSDGQLRHVRFRNDERISKVRATGESELSESQIEWSVPSDGGELRWQVQIAHERNGNGYDALLEPTWGIFRAEDIIPRASTRATEGTVSKTTMVFDLPADWSVVTAYEAVEGVHRVVKPQRRFDQPDGWIAVGKLGVRREVIAGSNIAIAGPVGQSVRRLDMLALLNWTLPELSRLLGGLPPSLTIISAGDPMWRGGLSGPHSLYIHAERPLLSENATSTLLHEIMHSSLRIAAQDGYDWIVEGLAEYYTLKLLRVSGTISSERYAIAMAFQENWAERANRLCRKTSKGATTALAVGILAELDDDIQQRSSGAASLDDTLGSLRALDRRINLQDLQNSVRELTGAESALLRPARLSGCSDYEEPA